MPLLQTSPRDPLVLRLSRDLTRSIKRGHPWVYAEALRERPHAPAGSLATLLDHRQGREIAQGFYDPNSPLAFRACSADERPRADEHWADRRLVQAFDLRRRLFDERTTGYRILNGEGDGVPGLVVDRYGSAAVVKFDGPGPAGFWNAEGIADRLASEFQLDLVVERSRNRGEGGHAVRGTLGDPAVPFLEYGLHFTSDLVQGQKTGFFLDQRDNRQLVERFADGRRVLNLFAYTGGFSIAAGRGGAEHVTSVDLAAPAVRAAERHWTMNGFDENRHAGVTADVFEFLEAAIQRRERWDLVVVDPPSFAPSQESVPRATAAYTRLFALATQATAPQGQIAFASCSSHIAAGAFQEICQEAVSQGRRRGRVLSITGQPADHPSPLALPEFRYLKFVLLDLN